MNGWDHAHAATVKLVGEGLQVIGRTKPRVELCVVGDPVAVVGVTVWATWSLIVLGYRTDPDFVAYQSRCTEDRHK